MCNVPASRARIKQYELSSRMQTAVPELADIASEPQTVREAYGAELGRVSFANNCLLARRLSESGVRFVQLYEKGWDSHGEIAKQHTERCRAGDRPSPARSRLRLDPGVEHCAPGRGGRWQPAHRPIWLRRCRLGVGT